MWIIWMLILVDDCLGQLYLEVGGDEAEGHGEHGQLYVPHPDRHVRALQDLLEVDAGEAREHAGRQGGHEPDELALLGTSGG